MFTIYSIGDSAFLAQILNSLAMICGTGDFGKLVAIGLLLGFFIMGIQCVMSGTRQFNLHQVFLGFICYLCFFGPAVTVHIEDAYTGQVRSVDNVPIGAGVAGTLISNIGYGVTQLFEQGYGDADRMTEHSFGDALKSLNDIRQLAYDTSIVDAASRSLGGNVNLRKSLDNYIRECTMVKIVVGQGTPEEVYTGGINSLGFQNTIYGTQVYLPGYNGSNLDCDAAWKQLKPQFEQAVNNPQTIAALNRLAGSMDAQGQIQTTYDRITNALEALNAGQISARDYVGAALLEPIYSRAAQGFYNDMGDHASAVMLNQALEQRNTQWAAEQSMFLSTIRPLMAFFEGFIYAITPIMAFMLVMGAFGMTMITKYFQVVAWIQLWMPVLSVVNLFILMAARNEFASVVTNPMSFYTLNNGSQILQNWIATGGMLAAATPMISLFLVTGSTYAFTSLTNRMGGADHISEKTASPDLVKPAEALSMLPMATSSAIGGVSATGSVLPTLDIGRGLLDNVTAARANVRTESDSVAQSMTRTTSDQSLRQVAAAMSCITGDASYARLAESYGTADGEQSGVDHSASRNTGTTQEQSGRTQAGVGLHKGDSFLESEGVRTGPNTKGQQAYEKAMDAYQTGQAFDEAATMSSGGKPQLGFNGKGNFPVGPVDTNTIEGIYREVPQRPADTVDVPAGGKSRALNHGATGGINMTAAASSKTSESSKVSEAHGRSVKSNFTESERAELSKQFSHAIQNMNSEQLSQLQGELKQAGISSNLSSVITAQESYSKAVSASNALGFRTSGKLNEIAGEIGKSKAAAAELRSQFVNMSMADKAAVNRAAEKFESVNKIDTGRAHDMAILQHMATNGRLGEAAAIYARSQGFEAPSITGPSVSNMPRPRTLDRTRGEKLDAPSFSKGIFEDHFQKTWNANENGEKHLKQGENYALNKLQGAIDRNDAKAHQRQVDKAVHSLMQPVNIDPGIVAGGFVEGIANILKSNLNPHETARELQNVGGLTATQAQYMANAMSTHTFSNSRTDELAEALVSETKALLGIRQDDHTQDNYAREIAGRIQERLDMATLSGVDNGGVGVLSAVKEFNDAVRGPMISHEVARNGAENPSEGPESLMTPAVSMSGAADGLTAAPENRSDGGSMMQKTAQAAVGESGQQMRETDGRIPAEEKKAFEPEGNSIGIRSASAAFDKAASEKPDDFGFSNANASKASLSMPERGAARQEGHSGFSMNGESKRMVQTPLSAFPAQTQADSSSAKAGKMKDASQETFGSQPAQAPREAVVGTVDQTQYPRTAGADAIFGMAEGRVESSFGRTPNGAEENGASGALQTRSDQTAHRSETASSKKYDASDRMDLQPFAQSVALGQSVKPGAERQPAGGLQASAIREGRIPKPDQEKARTLSSEGHVNSNAVPNSGVVGNGSDAQRHAADMAREAKGFEPAVELSPSTPKQENEKQPFAQSVALGQSVKLGAESQPVRGLQASAIREGRISKPEQEKARSLSAEDSINSSAATRAGFVGKDAHPQRNAADMAHEAKSFEPTGELSTGAPNQDNENVKAREEITTAGTVNNRVEPRQTTAFAAETKQARGSMSGRKHAEGLQPDNGTNASSINKATELHEANEMIATGIKGREASYANLQNDNAQLRPRVDAAGSDGLAKGGSHPKFQTTGGSFSGTSVSLTSQIPVSRANQPGGRSATEPGPSTAIGSAVMSDEGLTVKTVVVPQTFNAGTNGMATVTPPLPPISENNSGDSVGISFHSGKQTKSEFDLPLPFSKSERIDERSADATSADGARREALSEESSGINPFSDIGKSGFNR